MSKEELTSLSENSRRYYLDAMGIQCWEPLFSDVDESTGEVMSDTLTGDSAISDSTDSEPGVGETAWGFQMLDSAIHECKKCPLHATRKQAISGRGNQSAALMFVLLSPDKDDDESGTLCGGEALDLFSKMLAAINIPIEDVYITSLLKCHVPDLHTVSASEIHHCHDYLSQQICMVKPELLIILGDTAARCALQKDVDLDKLRDEMNTASVSDSFRFENVPLLVSYSPHELLQKTENKRKAWVDLQMIQQAMQDIAQ